MKNLRNATRTSGVSHGNNSASLMLRLLLALLVLPSLAEAGERTFGNGTLPEHLAMYDADDSGGLSEEELHVLREDRLQRQRRLRNRWDLDKDGTISNTEREAAKAQIRKSIEERRIKRFDEVDLNKDGQLTLAEFQRITAVTDADSQTPGVARRIFINLDSDKNNTVSKREFLLKLDTLPPAAVNGESPVVHPKSPLPTSPARPRR